MQTLSVKEIKGRIRALGVDVPQDLREKNELHAFLLEAAAAKRAEITKKLGALSRPAADMKIPELKNRLLALGLEIPNMALEKQELVDLVLEAEKELLGESSEHVPPTPKAVPPPPRPIPKPWYQWESRSKPGCFYYVNHETGETRWELPSIMEDSVEIVPEVVEPVPLPEKHDYRDDAFADGVRQPTSARSWCRDGLMQCAFGTLGVTTLTMSRQPESVPRNPSNPGMANISDKALIGDKRTWVRGEIIGCGALGRVFKALDQHSGQLLAVKEVLLNVDDDEDSQFKRDLENEVDILSNLKHVHIVSYLGHDYIDRSLFLYLEHMPGGSVTQALQQFGAFEESLMADYSKQVLDGLEYLHTRNPVVVHRDIKGSNILLGIDCRAKLADFGCSKRTMQTLTHTMRGSVPWMAPEVIKFSKYNQAADIWSFGCFVIEMGTASVPWGRFDNQMAALTKIGMSSKLPKLPDGISETCQDFIIACVQRNPDERPSATELLNHELIKDILPFLES